MTRGVYSLKTGLVLAAVFLVLTGGYYGLKPFVQNDTLLFGVFATLFIILDLVGAKLKWGR